jgi:hypothetical protein
MAAAVPSSHMSRSNLLIMHCVIAALRMLHGASRKKQCHRRHRLYSVNECATQGEDNEPARRYRLERNISGLAVVTAQAKHR